MFSDQEIERAVALRQHFHANPELKFEEHKTAARVAQVLEELGYAVTQGIAGTGVVGLLDTGRPGKTIALRADMDALPILEKTGAAYASATQGLMHACGHDGHTATLLLAAMRIAAIADRLNGRVKLIFQPGEEGGLGAAKMIDAGVLDGVDAIFGYHNRPGFKQGEVFVKSGPAMGGCDQFELTIQGRSGHASRPDQSVDPIYVGSLLVQALQGIVSRQVSPLDAGVVTVAQFNAGQAGNIIPETAQLVINSRNNSPAVRERIVSQIEAVTKGICDAYGARYTLTNVLSIPALVNDAAQSRFALDAATARFPAGQVKSIDFMPTIGSEDFAFFLEKIPGCFFFVGIGEDKPYLHNDKYDFCDAILPIAAGTFVAITEDALK